MNYLQRLEHWGDAHHPKWLDIVRIGLGVFLVYKGVAFASNMGNVMDLMKGNVPFSGLLLLLAGHYLIYAHIAGGFLLAMGMLTRVACLIQIPVLLGAIIFINANESLLKPFSELLLSVVVLAGLIYFLIIGSGPWSWDRMSEQNEK